MSTYFFVLSPFLFIWLFAFSLSKRFLLITQRKMCLHICYCMCLMFYLNVFYQNMTKHCKTVKKYRNLVVCCNTLLFRSVYFCLYWRTMKECWSSLCWWWWRWWTRGWGMLGMLSADLYGEKGRKAKKIKLKLRQI